MAIGRIITTLCEKYGHFFTVCVIGCFLLGTSVASEPLSDADALNCPPLKLISRADWAAQPPQKPLDKLKAPASKAIIAHTATQNCTTQVS